MRTSLLLVLACSGSEPAAPPPPPPPKPVPVDAAAPSIDAATPDAGPDIPPMAIDAHTITDGQDTALRWGYAVLDVEGLDVSLFSTPQRCDSDRFKTGHRPGVEVSIRIPPGPGARFFAGYPAGASAFLWNADQTNDIPAQTARILGKQPFQMMFSLGDVLVTLEPVDNKAHARVRGTVEASTATMIGAASIQGKFDVELCEGLPDVPALRATAPSGPAHGTRGGKAVSAAFYQAIVLGEPKDKDEAIDLAIHRAQHGSLPRVFEILGYARKVPCPTTVGEHGDLLPSFTLQGIGGASSERPVTGHPQPTSLIFPDDKGSPADVWPAWIQLETLSFHAGDVVHATVWAESAHYDDVKGTFGGHLDAVVCEL